MGTNQSQLSNTAATINDKSFVLHLPVLARHSAQYLRLPDRESVSLGMYLVRPFYTFAHTHTHIERAKQLRDMNCFCKRMYKYGVLDSADHRHLHRTINAEIRAPRKVRHGQATDKSGSFF